MIGQILNVIVIAIIFLLIAIGALALLSAHQARQRRVFGRKVENRISELMKD